MRRVAYGLLVALLVGGMWPVAVLVGGLALLCAIAVGVGFVAGSGLAAGALRDPGAAGAGEGVVRGSARAGRRYYGWLKRIRHPAAWGVLLGLVVGTGAVWGLLAVYVMPRERRTLAILADAQAGLERRYAADGHYPAAEGGVIHPSTVGETAGPDPVVDAFGRPLSYRMRGAWKVASYTISSLGADGVASDDDLCVKGGTRVGQWVAHLSGPIEAAWSGGLRGGWQDGLRQGLAAIEDARCRAPGRN